MDLAFHRCDHTKYFAAAPQISLKHASKRFFFFFFLMKLITQFMAYGLEIVFLLGTTTSCRDLKLPI